MLSALSSQESAIYGAFLSSADLIVHGPNEKADSHVYNMSTHLDGFAKSLSLKLLFDHNPETAASAATHIAKRVFTTSPIFEHSSPLVYAGTLVPSNTITFVAESNQEIMDSIVLAYRVSEDPKVVAPSAVLYEYPNFIETVRLPNIIAMKNFLQKPRIDRRTFGASKHNVNIEAALPVIQKTEDLWKKKFHRAFGLYESYKTEDAKEIIVMAGFHFPTCKAAVDKLRTSGRKVGAVRIRTINPFPSEIISKMLASTEKVSVLDSSVFGTLLASKMPLTKSKFIYNKYLSVNDFVNIFANIGKEGNFVIN